MIRDSVFSLKFLIFLLSCALSQVSGQDNNDYQLPKADKNWDWIKLDSGEVLKGEIQVMYEDELEFDSDHFGMITIDWDDVVEINTIKNQSIRTESRQILTGKVTMQNDEVLIELGQAKRTIKKADVVSIATGRKRELDKWNARVSVGTTARSGNVEQFDYNIRSTVQRRTANTRLYWDYTGNFSETSGIDTADNHRTNAYFDYYFTKRFFLRPISLEYLRDPFSNIANRYTLSSAVGYLLVDKKKLSIDVSGGPSWQYVEFNEFELEASPSESSPGALVTAVVDWEITKRIDFIGSYRAQYAPKESGGISTHFDNTLEVEITDDIDFNISLIWDYLEFPVSAEDGSVPGNSDFWLVFGLGIDM